jgi:Ca2+-dependent lipid-binding protein
MIKLYAKTPHSLGNTTMLDIRLTDSLLQLGLAAGEMLEKQRTKDALNLLRKKLFYPSLGEAETFERTLDICLGVVRGIRECSIVVWDEHDSEAVLLCTCEIPTIYDRNLEFSFTEVTLDSIESVTPFNPIIKVEQSKVVEWVSVELKVPTGYISHNNHLRRRLFANFVRSRTLDASAAAAEVGIFLEVITCLSECMDIEWQREQRNKHRKELIKQIEGRLFSWRSLSVQDICHNTTQIAATVLPGADVYSGVLVNNANSVQFLAATPNSGMVDKVLKRPAGVSFDVVENLETVVLQPGDDNKGRYLNEGTTCQVYYGRKPFKGRITKDRGHEKYDVCYLELKGSPIEAGVDIKRIVPMHTAFKVKTLGNKLDIPFICVPLRHRNKGIGVLGIDGIGAVPRAPYETQPESGMKRFLEQLGRILGTTIDLQKKKLSMKNLTLVTSNFNSGIDEVLEAAFETISENMQFVESIFCARILYESRILAGGKTGINVLRRWGLENTDAEKRVATFNIKRSNQKPVQLHGERNVWLLLKLHGMNRFVKGKIYVVSITQKVLPISDPDLDFLNVLQKVLKNSLQSIDLKTASGDSKSTALLDIKKMVSMWDKVNRDLLFNTVADRINQCYLSANIYLGRLTAHGKELNFILASQRSNMKGKRLPRDKKNTAISIQAIDEMNRTVITPSMDKANNLVHFGPPEGFEYPYVAIPLVAHIDSPVGVLCGDACEDPSADAEDTGDVLSFFGAVGMHLSEAVRGYSAQDAMEALNKIALEYSTVRQGMREIKRVVLGVLPYATRVSEVCYEPRETHFLATNDLGELDDIKSKTSTDFVLLVRVLKSKCTAANVTSPVLIMNWMGQQIYKCNIKRRMDTKPMKLRIHRGTFNSKVQLQLTLQGNIDGTRKDVSKKTLTMQYLSNVPTYPIEHVLDSLQDANVHVGGTQIVTKIFASNQIVEMCILSITIRGLAKADEFGLSDPFVIVKWNGDEIGKTTVIQDNLDPVWKDLKFELRIGSINPFDCSLFLEVWDQDLIGRGDFLGCVILEGEDLVSLFTSNSNVVLGDMKEDSLTQDMWISLVNHPKMATETQTLVQGRMKMTGTVIVAGDLTEAQMNHELDIMGQMDVAGGVEGDGMDEEEGEGYHECELRVVSARDLSLSESRAVPSSFAIVRFNNEELGRTAVLDGTENPEWEDETFTIRAPGGDRLEECNLNVEIYHVGSGGKGEFIGQAILTGKELVSLIAATRFKSRWIDVIEPGNTISGGGRGQIQLGGRPSSVDIDGVMPKAPEKGILEIGVLSSRGVAPWSLTNYDSAMSAGNNKRKFYFQVKFNDKVIHRSVAVSLTKPAKNNKSVNKDETFVESKMSSLLDESFEGNQSTLSSVDDATVYPLVWSKGQANAARLRHPNKRALSDCELEVEIWSSEVVENDHERADSADEGADKGNSHGNEDDNNVEKLEEKAIAKLQLKGRELDSLLGKQGFKTRWVPLQVKSSEFGVFSYEMKLRCGPEGSEDYYDLDGREIWLDIMGTSDIPRRSAHVFSEIFLHNIDKYNTYFHNQCSPMVVVRWNGKIIGETVTVRNDVDAIWSNMRFVIRPPLIDDVRESLFMCELVLEIYDMGPGHVATNKYVESHHSRDEEHEHIRVLIGRVVLKGRSLVDFMAGDEAENVSWFSIAGPDPSLEESKYYDVNSEKSHPFGQVRVRAAPAGTTSAVPSPKLRADSLLHIVCASDLAKPDAFSESNPYVLVDLNGTQLYRTDEVRDNSNPEFNNHLVFHIDTLRNYFSSTSERGNEESKEIDTKKKSADELVRLGMMGQIDRLTISVMNHNVIPHQMDEFLGSRVWLGHQIEEFLRQDVSDLTLELNESVELLPEENEYVQGSISLNISSLPSAPDQVISQRDVVVHIKSVADIANTRAMGSGSDVHMKVFRRFRSEGNHEEKIYTTKIISSTLAPVFTDELVCISVPTSEEDDIWSGLVVRFELWDVATLDFLGCVVLKGKELYALVNHNDKSAFTDSEFPLVDLPNQSSKKNKSMIVGEEAVSLIKGVLTVTGGYKSYFDANYKSERVAEPEVLVEEAVEEEEVELIDESGEEIEVHIVRATDLPKADGFMGKSDPYCIVRWNEKEVGRTSVIYKELNPEWDEEKFKFSLAAMPESTEEEATENAPEISLKSVLDIDIWDMDTLGSGDFLGTVQITGSALANLLSPEVDEVEYPLSPSSLLTPRGNKLATKGTITLKAALVNQQRADEIRAKKAREAKQREIEKNPGLQASRIELHIQSAFDLAKVNMRGGANAYVKIYWLDNAEKSRSNDKLPPDAVSQVVNNSLNPEFDNEILYFEKTAGMKVSECNMRLCVYSKGTMRDEFLGEVNLTGADVVQALPTLNVHGEFIIKPETHDLVSGNMKDNSKYVKGKLTFALKQIGVEADDGESHSVLPPGMKEMELTVVAGSNLPKANAFGLSDPYCVVKWGSREVGKTVTISECCDPVYEDQMFILRVPDDLGLPYYVKEAANIEAEAKAFKKLQRRLAMEGKAHDDEEVTRVLALSKAAENAAPPKELFLSVDVYDWNALNSGIFMGCVELSGEELNEFAAGDRHKMQWFPLGVTRRMRKSDQSLVNAPTEADMEDTEWPRLELMLGPHNVTSGDEKTESEIVIHLQVCAARGLAKADTFGSADPYVKVFWNNQRVGTTAVISNNQTPIWDDEKYTLQIQHPWKLDECILYLEVWDSDTAGPGEFLGSLTLNGDELKNFVEESAFSPSWYELGESDVLPAAIQDLAQGEIEIRLSEAGALNKVRETGQKFEIEIIGATNLARADGMFGLSDPYAIVKWNHNELGRTPYISKTLSPVWEEGNVFSVWVNMEDDVGNNLLQIDVWDYDMIGNGKFLGCAIIEDFDLDHQFKPAVLQDEDKTGTFDLKEDPRREGMTIPGNIQPKGQLEFKIRNPDDSNVTLASAMNLKWDSERDLNAGQPCFELDILSVNNLPITRVLSKSCSPKCFVYWNDDELGSTETGSSTNHTFADEHFTLKIPHLVEMNNVSLYVEVWDMQNFGRGDLLGVVHLPFRAVLRLQFGECTLNLYQKDRNQYTRGTLTFHLKIAYPFWDSMAPLPPTKIMRKIGIYSAANLPGINDETPSTKGVIMVNGVIKTKTMISVKTSSPIWQKAECIVLVDLHKPIDVVIVVYHIDLKVKKEIAIGQFVVPFELLVRPPKSFFDASLSPPIKTPPKKYKFTVAGNVKISITPDDAAMNNMRPYSADIQRPEGSLVIHDISPHSASKSKQDILYDGEMLTEEQKLWLGTHVDFTRVETLPTRPNWIIMPIFDMGQRVGFKAVDLLGTKPGHRMALCIERPIDRKAISDPVILQDIWQAVNRCVNNLRRKEIYKVMRERAMERFAKFIQGATELEGFDGSQVDAWINDAISTCCPGVRFYTASVSPDFQSLRYTLFESNGSTRSFTIFQKQSNEWDFAGKHPPRSLIVKKASDFANRRITSYVPFPNTSLPRFVVPLAAGDVSLGFFGVEKFDVYLGRVGDDLTDERDLQKWFEDLGKLCGDVIYAGREKRALHEMETYTLGSTATKDGVVVEILRSCMHVLQGCKLMEVWQIDKNDHIRSLAAQQPPAAPLPGRKVLLKGMKLKIIGGKRTGGLMGLITLPPDENDEQNVLDAVGVGGGGFQGEGGSRPGTAATDGTGGLGDEGRLEGGEHGEESAESAFVDEVGQPVYHTFLVGLRYDGVEQLHQVKIEEQDLVVEIDLDMHFVITYDRNIHVTLYHIDKRAHTLEDWYGKIAFANFKETNMKTSLYTHKNTFANWDVEFSFEWDEESSVSVGSDVKVEDIKLFNLNIRCARDLMPCDGDTSDPFCEIYYDGTMIGKTKYIDKDLNPEFNEDFIVPFSGKKAPLIIDMFDMSMVGKGQFLGRVDIPFDLLITPPPGEFEYPLKIKSGLAARKQQKVGGMLTLAYSMEMRKVEQRIDAAEVAAQDINLLDIPQQVWPMKVPALYLTIHSALDLAKANLFGGGSDPFVVVYLDFKKPAEDPLFKTRVIDDNLSPVWEESFSIPLGVNMTPGATTAKDFPTIRLEVYDHNRIMKGEFLGMCEIPPAVYFQRKNGEFKLGPKKSLSRAKNKLAQGELSASFNIQDSTSVQLTNDFKISEYGFLKGIPFVEVESSRLVN